MPNNATFCSKLVAIVCTAAVCAQTIADTPKSVDVPAGELAVALRELARQSGVEFVYSADQLKGVRTTGVQGEYTAEQAVTKLLEGTNLKVTVHPSGALLISDVSAPGASALGVEAADSDESRSRLAQADTAQNAATASRDEWPASAAGSAEISSQPGLLEEIIVTAQKREQRLLDVPMSISAVTGEMLTRQGAYSLTDIASTVPGLSSVENAPGQNRLQLRGISATAGTPTVGRYLDELPINVEGNNPSYGMDIRFIDLARVEVLRGPQGTLYGEGSSMGGTVRYLTRDPDLDSASFGFDGAWGGVSGGSELYRGNVVINVPVVEETFGLRFAGGYEHSPGWIEYPRMGAKDVNDGEAKTARVKGLWRVTDALTARLLLLYQDNEFDSWNLAEPGRAAPFVQLSSLLDESRLANLVLEYDAGSFTILSSSGYLDRDVATSNDITDAFLPIYSAPPPFGLGFPPGSVQTVTAGVPSQFEALSQEVRFASAGEGPLTWTAGLYYRDYEERFGQNTIAVPNPLPFELLTSDTLRGSEQSAVFGEIGYEFTPAFETTVGLRYFRDQRTQSASGAQFGFPTTEPAREDTFSAVSPRLVLSYHLTEDMLLYASAAKGFRSGGLNLVAARPPGCSLQEEYDPEELWTYELGSNLSAANGRIVVQGAIYYNDWQDIQLIDLCPLGQTLQFTNAGKASGAGVDLQVTLRPTDALGVSLSAGYNDSQYDETSMAHVKGDAIDFVPQFTGAVSGDYDFNWSQSLRGRAHLDYQYTDSWSLTLRSLPPFGPVSSEPYGRLNARLSVLSGAWEISLFGENLTDTDKIVGPPFGNTPVPTSMRPRTIGVGLRYNYE